MCVRGGGGEGILNGIVLTLLKLNYIVLKQLFQTTQPFVATLKRLEQRHNSFFIIQQNVKI